MHRDDLNDVMQFDHIIEVCADGSVIDREGIYAPECYWDTNTPGNINFGGDNRWTALNGYSGQDRYSGPVMHPSEYIGGRMADDILDTPGIYVAIVVNDLDDLDEPAGWAVLRLNA